MTLSSDRRAARGVLSGGALALAFAAAFGHAGGEPKADPVRAETLTVSSDVPPIPVLALRGAPPGLAKPAAHARRPKRRRAGDAAPARPHLTEQHADPSPGSPAAATPLAPRPRRRASPAPSGGGRRSGGGNSGAGGGDSTDNGAVTPAVTPAPVQVAPAPVEPDPVEEDPAEDRPPVDAP